MITTETYDTLFKRKMINETPYDHQFRLICQDIIDNGSLQDEANVRAHFADGEPAPAIALFGQTMQFDTRTVPPVPTTKKLFSKTAVNEMLLFWQQKTNKLEDFHKVNVRIWDEWEIKDKDSEWNGTIGPAYGYQLGRTVRRFPVDKLQREHLNTAKLDTLEYSECCNYVLLDQVDFLIQTLLTNPESRQLTLSLWDVKQIDQMALPPCVWSTSWTPINGMLNLMLNIRSNDMALGNAFNVYQYFVLLRMIAQVTGMRPGILKLSIANAHVYERHVPELERQMDKRSDAPLPSFTLNPHVKNFYEFTAKDAMLVTNEEYEVFKFDTAI